MQVQVRRPGGRALLGFEPPALLAVGGGGVDHLEHPPTEHLQGSRVVVPGQIDQVPLGPVPVAGADLIWEHIERTDDRAGLLEVEAPGRERVPGGAAGGVEGLGQPQVGVGPAAVLPGAVREPCHGRGVTGVGGDVVAVGGNQHPQPQLGHSGLQPGQVEQRGPLLLRGHRPGRGVGQPVQDLVSPGTEGGEGVRPRGGLADRHGTSLLRIEHRLERAFETVEKCGPAAAVDGTWPPAPGSECGVASAR